MARGATQLLLAAMCTCFALRTISAAAVADPPETVQMMRLWASAGATFPPGDPRRCLDLLRSDGAHGLRRFEVLPGHGWDNLRNIPQGQVVSLNYSTCTTTDDGRFLLPDTVAAVPVKTSRVESFADLIQHYSDWTSVDSRSINVDAGLHVSVVQLGGKFSDEFTEVKTKQVMDKTATTRAQIRYVRYAVQLQPDTPLHPVFKGRVLDIAAAHQLNDTATARYLSQLLVRDFGTHVITGASAGAALLKVDQISNDFVQKTIFDKKSILAAASFGLFSKFGLSTSGDTTSNTTFMATYNGAMSSSTVSTLGGPVYRPINFTLNEWASQMDKDLVALDRFGLPLNFLVTPATLPELPVSTLTETARSVGTAVELYYKLNRVPGCMDLEAPNFSPAANVDDGTCSSPTANLTFGGVYQTCQLLPGSSNGDLCQQQGLEQKNPLTADLSCPQDHEPVMLHQGTVHSSRSEHSCNKFWFVKYDCEDRYYASAANYTSWWCVATGEVLPDSGYLFGGVYTDLTANPVTQTASCPAHYQDLKIGSGNVLHVCVSDDYQFGVENSVPFAGFSSCSAGNPLAVAHITVATNASSNASVPWVNVEVDVNRTAPFPQGCPRGFSQHLATVDQDCELRYCVSTVALQAPVTPHVKRPPFLQAPALPPPPQDNEVVFDRATRRWLKNEKGAAYSNMIDVFQAAQATPSKTVPGYLVSNQDFRAWLQQSQVRAFNRTMQLANQGKPSFRAYGEAAQPQASNDNSVTVSVTPTVAAALAIVGTLSFVVILALTVITIQACRGRRDPYLASQLRARHQQQEGFGYRRHHEDGMVGEKGQGL